MSAESGAPDNRLNVYDYEVNEDDIASGFHRQFVGGMWDEIGALQFEFLKRQGLTPDAYLLDVGCGSLRGGIHFIGFLEPAHYFGIDLNESLIGAGLSHEVPAAGLQDKVDRSQFHVTSRFDVPFDQRFDYAVAVSVFTHLPLNHIQLALYQLSRAMKPGGRFFATFFERPPDTPFADSIAGPVITTYPEQDPFHYPRSTMEWAGRSVADWDFHYIGNWNHPRDQRMVEYRLKGSGSGLASRIRGRHHA
jgi:SAM-dependent methyltransferase